MSRMSKTPLHTVVETAAFTGGKVVKNTGGLRKGRVAKESTGKSGGYRVFSFFTDRENPAFLLWILDKSDDDTLTREQENAFKALTTLLKKEVRK
jgi:hypothetical protein